MLIPPDLAERRLGRGRAELASDDPIDIDTVRNARYFHGGRCHRVIAGFLLRPLQICAARQLPCDSVQPRVFPYRDLATPPSRTAVGTDLVYGSHYIRGRARGH